MVQICDICGRKQSQELWKYSTKQICSSCAQQQLLEGVYTVISSDAREPLRQIDREIELLLDKQHEEQALPLMKKGLSYINGYLIHEIDFAGIEGGIHWFNETMKKEGRLDSIRFVVERNYLAGNVRFIVVLFLRNGNEPESWKFFTGRIPRD
ncbi:MAG: hypothetical protein P1Q69_10465 [Candidatus Thorarchaeota archaeon]|nr:hypothetical protein [Candidatus Thorarchaeota archaeon]